MILNPDNKKMPICFVIFGVTGDLAQSKLIPAIFNLYRRGKLPKKFKVVGYSRRDISEVNFKKYISKIIDKNDQQFFNHFTYVQGYFDQKKDYSKLGNKLLSLDEQEFKECSHKLFYLAVPPVRYAPISKHLSESGQTIPCGGKNGWTRILIEKPFGRDIKTARKLNLTLGKLFDERQIFRIDHYLAKEASQNILKFRFKGRNKYQKIWSGKFIEKIEINLLEREGVKNRGAFYDQIGVLRDVGQNHMLQMLALVTMKKPKILNAESIQRQRAIILERIRAFKESKQKDVLIRGQYQGYTTEKGVAKNSNTETFFDLTLSLKDQNWKGTTFRLRSGKGLKDNKVEIIIYFRKDLKPLIFDYSKHTGKRTPDAYEKVFFDCVIGDQTVFTSTREVEAAWKFITPILKKWKNLPLMIYPKGIGMSQ